MAERVIVLLNNVVCPLSSFADKTPNLYAKPPILKSIPNIEVLADPSTMDI